MALDVESVLDGGHPASAEEAFKTAIALAKEQGARTYELLTSLSLAKLSQSKAGEQLQSEREKPQLAQDENPDFVRT